MTTTAVIDRDHRVQEFFAWLPVPIRGRWYWLQRVRVLQARSRVTWPDQHAGLCTLRTATARWRDECVLPAAAPHPRPRTWTA